MPTKNAKKKSSIISAISTIGSANKISSEKDKSEQKPVFFKLLKILAAIYFVIWILIGLFFLTFIYGNWKQGAFKGLFAKAPQASEQVQAPTETSLPGVGKVNISCVQSSLSSEAIQKLVTDGSTKNLTDEEKAKLEPCIIQKEETPPQASPTPAQ